MGPLSTSLEPFLESQIILENDPSPKICTWVTVVVSDALVNALILHIDRKNGSNEFITKFVLGKSLKKL